MVLVTHCISLIKIAKSQKWVYSDQSDAAVRLLSFRKTWDFEHNICEVPAGLARGTHKMDTFPTFSSRTTPAVLLHMNTVSPCVRVQFV